MLPWRNLYGENVQPKIKAYYHLYFECLHQQNFLASKEQLPKYK